MNKEIEEYCTKALKGCTECKASLADIIVDHLKDIREKREELVSDQAKIEKILEEGSRKARALAAKPMEEVKKAVGMA